MLREFYNTLGIGAIGTIVFYILTLLDIFITKGENTITYYLLALLFQIIFLIEYGGK